MPEVRASRITTKTAPESKTWDGFASRGATVLSSPRLQPVENSGRFFNMQAFRIILFRRSCSDDSSQQIPYHGGGALSPSSLPAISYQPVAAYRGRCSGAKCELTGESSCRPGDTLRP